MKYYNTIIIGAGAAGLLAAANITSCKCYNDTRMSKVDSSMGQLLVLEKTSRPGTKLLMAGAGQCNLTNARPIKEFIDCYGDKGKKIRSCLYKHNNLEFMKFMEELGVPLFTREDGKVFPKSLDSKDVLKALLLAIEKNGGKIHYKSEVTAIRHADASAAVYGADGSAETGTIEAAADSSNTSGRWIVETAAGGSFSCRNLVVAAGGSSYPTTGSDGTILQVLSRDLGLDLVKPKPALVPVYVENYPFSDISGISIKNAEIKIFPSKDGKMTASVKGDLLFTHKNLSGPVIINNSRHMMTGGKLEINFLPGCTSKSLEDKMKKAFPGNGKIIENWLSENLEPAKRFLDIVCEMAGVSGKKVSSLKGDEIKSIASALTQATYTISGSGSFKEAMATAGGVSLKEINPTTMETRRHPGLYIIGEVLDIDGDTGGYNIQFAYSSAKTAAEHILL